MSAYRRLTADQADLFRRQGYVHLEGALPADFCREQVALAWEQLQLPPQPESTDAWPEERLHMSGTERFQWQDRSPMAWDIICDLLGGEDRVKDGACFGNGMVVNFCQGRATGGGWEPPSPTSGGWHKDGNFFRHYLDSPEQGLLGIIIWQDIKPQAGGTFIAPDSIGHIARLLAANPQGFRPGEFNFTELMAKCSDFRELTGRQGDVVLMHPYMVHAGSKNPSGIARFITNPVIAASAPFVFDRPDPADQSLVEQCILDALGVAQFPFQITGEREYYQPNHTKKFEEYKKKLQAS